MKIMVWRRTNAKDISLGIHQLFRICRKLPKTTKSNLPITAGHQIVVGWIQSTSSSPTTDSLLPQKMLHQYENNSTGHSYEELDQ